jgi:LacI family transcriptional regulator, kdg operon repressor
MSDTPEMARRRATISDVAREACTGKTSISRYLNVEFSVLSPDLRGRIEAAIARLDYHPNQMARGLKRGRNRLIGLLIADLANPYSVEILQGVEEACHRTCRPRVSPRNGAPRKQYGGDAMPL